MEPGAESGYFIFYNMDFYCIQIHDEEVACDGLLFNNIHDIPMTVVPNEFTLKDSSQEEMIRTYLKQIFIKSTRLWKLQHLDGVLAQQHNDHGYEDPAYFSRLFFIKTNETPFGFKSKYLSLQNSEEEM